MRVLVVDDDATFCQFLAEMLEAEGLQVEQTTDGWEAYQWVCRQRYDLYISDVRMPSMSGTELAEKIKQTDPHAKIILISAFVDPSVELRQHPDVHILSKPFSAACLWQTVSQILDV